MSAVDWDDVPNPVRILHVNEAIGTSIDLAAPVIIRGAFDRTKQQWEERWLTNGLVRPDGQRLAEPRAAPPDGRNVELLFHTEEEMSRVSEILASLDLPSRLRQLGPAQVWFYIGAAWSGTLPHMKAHAISALARGRKRWAVSVGGGTVERDGIVRESDAGPGSGTQVASWFATECPKLKSRGICLWEFIQESGDVVFIPANYPHAVLNLEPAAGFTAEFRSAASDHQDESWSANFERLLSANCMTGPLMEASARRLLPYIDAHGLGRAVLELGPNRHPLITPDKFDGRIVYLELSDPCIQSLREQFGDSVAIVKFNLHRAWEGGDNALKTHLANSLHRDPMSPVQFDSVVLSQIVNYVDFRQVLRACVEMLPCNGRLFFNNVMNLGSKSVFHPRRPRTMDEFLEAASEIGFDPLEVVAEPAGQTRTRHLAVLRRRA